MTRWHVRLTGLAMFGSVLLPAVARGVPTTTSTSSSTSTSTSSTTSTSLSTTQWTTFGPTNSPGTVPGQFVGQVLTVPMDASGMVYPIIAAAHTTAGGDGAGGVFKGVPWGTAIGSVSGQPNSAAYDVNGRILVDSDFPFRSTDGGATFSRIGCFGNNVFPWGVVVPDPSDHNTTYLAPLGGSVFKLVRTDNDFGMGCTNQADSGLPGAPAALVIDPTNTSVLYAGTGGGIYKTTNKGGSWSFAGTGGPTASVFSLAIDPGDHTIVYAGAVSGGGSAGVWKSTNAGGSWTLLTTTPVGVHPVRGIAFDPSTSGPTAVYIGTAIGVFKSTDGGTTWSDYNTGFPSTMVIGSLVIDRNGVLIHAGTGFVSPSTGARIYSRQLH